MATTSKKNAPVSAAKLTEPTALQISDALMACRILVSAYEVASEDNGGGSEVDWETVDSAHEMARKALGKKVVAELRKDAKQQNKGPN